MQKRKEQPREELYGDLGRLFDFTRGDLEANRAGFITYRQRQVQSRNYRNLIVRGVFLSFIFLTLFFACIAGYLNPNCQTAYCLDMRTLEKQRAEAYFLLCSSFPLFLLGIWFSLGYLRAMRENRLERLSGHLRTSVSGGRGTSYYLICGTKSFSISRRQYEFPWKETPYLIYYLPANKAIISIEELLPE